MGNVGGVGGTVVVCPLIKHQTNTPLQVTNVGLATDTDVPEHQDMGALTPNRIVISSARVHLEWSIHHHHYRPANLFAVQATIT